MAITTFSELKTAVANWLHRSDLTSIIPDFVSLAESRIRHDVRCRAMEATATGTLTTSEVALPTRFAEARRVMLDDEVLTYAPLSVFHPRREWESGVYTIEGSNFIFPDTTGTYEIQYYAWFAAFSGASDTNTLLTNHPDIYLFAALAEAAQYVGDNPAPWLSRYEMAVQRLRSTEQKAFAGPLVVRVEGNSSGYTP